MKFIHLSFTIAFFLQIITIKICNAQVDLKSQVSISQIDSLFASWDDPKKPGIAIGIVNNGKIEHLRGYGSANLEHNVPITAQTKFHYTGMSDQIIAFGILLLNERSELSLNDDIRKYIPSLSNITNPITIHHLLNHTSGLQDLAVIKQFAGWKASDEFTSDHKNQLLENFRTLESKPGKEYLSKQIESKLLQDIIEKVSGQSISEFTNEKIFIPLGMTNSLFTNSSSTVISNRAQGYNNLDGQFEVAQMPHDKGQVDLFYSTVEDMCKWAQNFSKPIVGSQKLLASFESFVTIDGKPAELKNTSQYIGQHRYWDFNGVTKLYLIGMQAGYACKLVRFPDQDLSIVVMGNGGDYNGHWSSFAAQLYLDAYFDKPNEEAPSDKKEYVYSTKDLKKHVGSYWEKDDLFSTHISIDNDTLKYYEEEYNWTMNLKPIAKDLFTTSHGHKIEFVTDKKGKQLLMTSPRGNSYCSLAYNKNDDWTNSLHSFVGSYCDNDLNSQFDVELNENRLLLTHFKLGSFELIPLHKNKFKTTHPTFKYIQFSTDEDQNKFLTITNASVKDFVFKKSSQNNPF